MTENCIHQALALKNHSFQFVKSRVIFKHNDEAPAIVASVSCIRIFSS